MIDLASLPRMGVFAIVVRDGLLTAAPNFLAFRRGHSANSSESSRRTWASVFLQRMRRRLSLTKGGGRRTAAIARRTGAEPGVTGATGIRWPLLEPRITR